MLSYVVLGPFVSDIFLFELLFSFYVLSVILIFLLSVYIYFLISLVVCIKCSQIVRVRIYYEINQFCSPEKAPLNG